MPEVVLTDLFERDHCVLARSNLPREPGLCAPASVGRRYPRFPDLGRCLACIPLRKLRSQDVVQLSQCITKLFHADRTGGPYLVGDNGFDGLGILADAQAKGEQRDQQQHQFASRGVPKDAQPTADELLPKTTYGSAY